MGLEELCLGPFCIDSCPRVSLISSFSQQSVLSTIASAIENASRIVTVASFVITLTRSSPAAARIRTALISAARRGVDVLVILDGVRENAKRYNCGTARVLGRRGVNVWLSRGRSLHMKVYAADDTVIVGSMNVSSQESLEAAIAIVSRDLAYAVHTMIRELKDRYGGTWESVCHN
ncbi:MAG: phospholipase D-like domain-containing protein [Sulfolobales archaeon]